MLEPSGLRLRLEVAQPSEQLSAGFAPGGKGAAIGAGVGAGSGLGGGGLTGNSQIDLPAETNLRFQLTTPVTLK